jgi:hypothetical protein
VDVAAGAGAVSPRYGDLRQFADLLNSQADLCDEEPDESFTDPGVQAAAKRHAGVLITKLVAAGAIPSRGLGEDLLGEEE